MNPHLTWSFDLQETVKRYLKEQFPKHCPNCEASFSDRAWRFLKFIGFEKNSVEYVELRECVCGTLIKVVDYIYDPFKKVGLR